MNYINLEWKNFTINLDKLNAHFKSILSSNYDGMVCDETSLHVMFKDSIEESDTNLVNSYWDVASAQDFQPTLSEIITIKINDATQFGNNLISKATIENVAMGITQYGKTKEVADLFVDLQYYLKTGSLYAAITELDLLINAGLDPSLAPFVTEARLTSYKTQIQSYLGI